MHVYKVLSVAVEQLQNFSPGVQQENALLHTVQMALLKSPPSCLCQSPPSLLATCSPLLHAPCWWRPAAHKPHALPCWLSRWCRDLWALPHCSAGGDDTAGACRLHVKCSQTTYNLFVCLQLGNHAIQDCLKKLLAGLGTYLPAAHAYKRN